MPFPRTADDKLLALLALQPAPLETADIAEALKWSRQNVLAVALRLEREQRLVRIKGARDGSVGRPADAFALPGAVTPEQVARPSSFGKDTYVLTPSGETARIVGGAGRAFVEFEYVTGPERFQRGTLHVSLLRAFQPGCASPEPVRVGEASA